MVARNPPPLPNVVYCTASNRIIDLVRKAETETEAIARLTPEYGPDLMILPLDEAETRFEAQFKTAPVQITEADWFYALEVLPPEDWHRTASAVSPCSITKPRQRRGLRGPRLSEIPRRTASGIRLRPGDADPRPPSNSGVS